jgi:hypothetical protein
LGQEIAAPVSAQKRKGRGVIADLFSGMLIGRDASSLRDWVLPGCIVAFVAVDGAVRGNSLPWAAPWRAGLVSVGIIAGFVVLLARSIRLEPVVAALAGVLAALVISESYQQIGGFGLSAFVLYAGAYAWQRQVNHDWRQAFMLSGSIIAWLVIVIVLSKQIPPNTLWNRNVIAGVLVVCLAGAWSLTAEDRGSFTFCVLIAAAIVITGSRGAVMGMAAVALVFVTRRVHLARKMWLALAVAGALGLAGLIALKPTQSYERLFFIRDAVQQWRDTSMLYGAGPGLLRVVAPVKSEVDYHAHNSLVSLAAQVGLMGAGVIGLALSTMQRKGWPVNANGQPVTGQRAFSTWQWATLAGVAAHSLVDDPLTWWPVGLALMLALGGRCVYADSV